ncbi:MAG: hypothetical protein R2695_13615 [Acidimicrobiales bacterium]
MTPALSIVVVAYDMARELPRTLHTLGRGAQRGEVDYEVIVVDNGSPVPVDPELLDLVPRGRLVRLDPAPPSPARAANEGIAAAGGATVGVLIDGARMASPGLVQAAARATTLGPRVIATTLAFHLGDEVQMTAVANGYDQATEDALLDSVDWRTDGYELFRISTFAASSARGWFGPMGESNALFMSRALWQEVGGFDESFDRLEAGSQPRPLPAGLRDRRHRAGRAARRRDVPPVPRWGRHRRGGVARRAVGGVPPQAGSPVRAACRGTDLLRDRASRCAGASGCFRALAGARCRHGRRSARASPRVRVVRPRVAVRPFR